MNEIVFPAAILQPPFFDPQADDATNYGAIGGVIGHEISHGFDDQGSRSDGDGNLRDWWTAEDKAAFQQRTGQLSDQYSSFSPLQGMNVNGKLTLGENIGDLSGLTVAYKAYKLSLGGKEAPVIEGFTGDQRFFLGWAQVWRTANREDALRQQLLTDPHSPGEYRVNGVVRNMPEFYSAFGVKEGDGAFLPADKRVKIW
jgi:putative endopeptidase